MIEINRCPVCDGRAFLPFITAQDYSISRETFPIIRCTDCGLLITTPRPSNDKLASYYSSPVYTSHVNTAKTIFDKIYFSARQFTLKWKLSLLENTIPASSQKNLLDFGCGTGEFLKVAKTNGWSTIGMEPSPFARQQADTTIAQDIKASTQEVTRHNQRFNAITLWHVLEHVENLNETLKTLKDLLEQSGIIFIAVPNHNSRDSAHYKQYWAGYDVPRHLWHFNTKSMKRLLENHALTLVRIIPMRLDAFYVSLLSEKYRDGKSISIVGMIKAFFHGLRSNYSARKSMEYSSLIYVIKK
jgi:2-polyprenyl-3-methyl-5-hydroxy-6-metoxy-1,4-benzoquinol methylase